MSPETRQDGITEDTLFDGALICRQHRNGYRFSVDAVLAAHFCQPSHQDRVLDLGTGCGIIGLILAFRHPAIHLVGLEIQASLAALARENIADNKYAGRFQIIEGDLCHCEEHLQPEMFQRVVCNPPYRRAGTGRYNVTHESTLARHEIVSSLEDIVRAAAFAVKNKGSVDVIYPAARTASLVVALQEVGLIPCRIQTVYSYPGEDEAKLVLIEARKNGGEGCSILAPFYIYSRKNGPFSQAMQQMYQLQPMETAF